MKTINKRISNIEMRKNLIVTGLSGAALGLLFGLGFENNMILSAITGTLFGLAIGFRISIRPPKMRYPMYLFRRVILSFGIMALTGAAYSYLLDLNLDQTQHYLVVLLPLAGWTFLVISLGTAIAHLDELQRRIQTEGIAIAFAGTAVLVAALALLQFAGLPEINAGLVLLIMAAMWLVGKLFTLWHYR